MQDELYPTFDEFVREQSLFLALMMESPPCVELLPLHRKVVELCEKPIIQSRGENGLRSLIMLVEPAATKAAWRSYIQGLLQEGRAKGCAFRSYPVMPRSEVYQLLLDASRLKQQNARAAVEELKVHAEVLKMAKSDAQRERIKWFHARRAFLVQEKGEAGLELARLCEHDDARFLVSLFAKTSSTFRKIAFRSSKDVRSLCWAAICEAEDSEERQALLRQSAEGGYAWAQALHAVENCRGAEQLPWLEKAAAQGDHDGMTLLAQWLWKDSFRGSPRAVELWHEAALLGCPVAQFHFGVSCEIVTPVRVIWWRRCAVQGALLKTSTVQRNVMRRLRKTAVIAAQQFDKGGGSGETMFELGAAFAQFKEHRINLHRGWRQQDAWDEAVKLFAKWSSEAKRAVLCWMWLSPQIGVMRDIRILVGNAIWSARSTWGVIEQEKNEK